MSVLTGAQNAAAQLSTYLLIIEEYEATKHTNYLAVAGFALVVADHLHTLPDEVRLIWPSPRSAPKFLFFLLRYYLFIHHIFAVLYGERVDLTPQDCKSSFVRLAISSGIVITIAEAILFLRVYAFSGKHRGMLIYLSIQYVAFHAAVFGVLARFLQTIEYVKYPFNNMTCMPSAGESELLGVTFTLLLASVTLVMLIMVYIAFLKNRESGLNSALMVIFYRDGIFYFICIFALASANIFVNFFAPYGYRFLFVQAEVDIHVILATRMLLHLRRWAERERLSPSGFGKGRQSGASEYVVSSEPVDYATYSVDYWTSDFGDSHEMEYYEPPRLRQQAPRAPVYGNNYV
ncbi:hypothetical protein NMY22_g737 [Coprinellus aureogranulatus]|nr:hypothetical protein NMY22_g737 [Coprinellus aureogranulatus]